MERATPLRRGWPSALPLGLLGMLAIVAGLERFQVRSNYAYRSGHATDWAVTAERIRSESRRIAEGGERPPEVLVLGDSLAEFGLYPRVIEAVTGRSALNLAVQTGPAPTAYVLFRRALQRGARPRAIVIDSAQGVLGEGPNSTTRPYPWSDLLSFAETFELAWTARDFNLLTRVILGKSLHVYKNREEIRKDVVQALRGQSTWERTYLPGRMRNWRVNRGAQVNPPHPFEAPEYPPEGEPLPTRWKPDPTNVAYLERIFETARAHGVSVFWLLPPLHPWTQAWSRYRGETQAYEQCINELQARHPEVVVLDARQSRYPGAVFIDSSHLDVDGATALSASIGQLIDARLDDPDFAAARSWVKVPDYQPTPVSVVLETTDQSHARVLANGATVRR